MKNEIDVNELKQIQLKILKTVHDFCVENDINYSLSSGTLIGAVRHKGFIPWDDDIDIYMLRPDFEKFEKEFKDPYLRIMSPNADSHCIYPYGKVYDSRTVLIENVDYSMDSLGVNIDVFVIDSVPDNYSERKQLFIYNAILDNIIIFKTIRFRKGRNLLKNVSLFFGKIVFSFIPLRWIVNKKYNLFVPFNHASKEICNVMAGNGITACIPSEYMRSFIDIEFEGIKFRCMKKYDKYLRVCYGDYMKLPPVEQRVTHHCFKAFWK